MWNGFVIFAFPFFFSLQFPWNEIKEEIGDFFGVGEGGGGKKDLDKYGEPQILI